MLHLRASVGAVLLLCFWSAASAAPPVMTVPEASSPPTLDGALDDACWRGLPEYTNFTDTTHPGRIVSPQTTVKICRDQQNIYVSFHALHPAPAKIAATQKKRNSELFYKDDFVYFAVDSTHSHRGYSGFMVNSIGTQAESLEGGAANKIEWRGDWRAAAKVVADGYNVEMAVPFFLLKYDKKQEIFGICFERFLPAEQLWSSWPDMEGRWDRTRFADWQGVNPPWERPKPVFMSYMTSSVGSGPSHHQFGMDIKHPFSTDMLGLLSLKPDFGTIEQAVETVDFSYTERSYSDKRPFFQDWTLPLPLSLFYSRQVPDFDVGARLVGKRGANSFGFMNARKPGSLSDSLVTFIHNMGNRSHITAALTDHETPGHRNAVGFLMGNLGWAKGPRTHDLGGAILASSTTGSDRGQLRDIHYGTYSGSGRLGGTIYYGHIDAAYNPELGFLPDRNMHGGNIDLDWYKDYRNRKLQAIEIWSSANRWQRLDGSPFVGDFRGGVYTAFTGGYGFSFRSTRSTREQFHDSFRKLGTYWHDTSADTPRLDGVFLGSKGQRKLQWRLSESAVQVRGGFRGSRARGKGAHRSVQPLRRDPSPGRNHVEL
ncbi:MAG: sugar-binding protein [Armatimonadota bacterium]|nr:sugar-binding protein [Armatimonadota bacterium]